jgi:hypothetical protein
LTDIVSSSPCVIAHPLRGLKKAKTYKEKLEMIAGIPAVGKTLPGPRVVAVSGVGITALTSIDAPLFP